MTEVPTPTPGYDGCEWPLDPACFDEEWEALDSETKARAQSLASATLHRLSGYRVGGCPVTVRPCKPNCASGFTMPSWAMMGGAWGLGFRPLNWNGVWVNSCGCRTDCGCTALCDLTLPAPVGVVYEVKLNGTVLDPTQYRVDGTDLVFVGGGECPWPVCQDLDKPDTEDGTFSVTFLNSYPPDQAAAYACAVLAMEFAKACAGLSCRLPPGVTTVARQGLTFTIPTGSFPDGLTGIREVDAWLALWNPDGIRQAPKVWSPDIRTPRVVRQ